MCPAGSEADYFGCGTHVQLIFKEFQKNLQASPMEFGRRKCDFTQMPITPKDRSSVQIYLAKLDGSGRATGETDVVDICGAVRASGKIDSMLLEYSYELDNKE